jgi:hypothetical protein
MPVRQVSPGHPKELSEFVELERKLVGHHRLFVSEDECEVARRLSGQSAFFDQSEVALFVSHRDEDPVARCAAIINRRWQNSEREPSVGFDSREVGFIGYFAAAPGSRVEVTEMLTQAEEWLADDPARQPPAAIRRVIAPCNGNALLGLGLRTDGFTESPMFPLPWNPRYYVDYFERAGYAPRYPFWTYEVDFSSRAYQRFKQDVGERAENASLKCTVTEVNEADWSAEIERLRELFNEGFRGEWELQEFTSEEFEEFHEWMEGVLPTQFMLFARVDGDPDPVGFCVGYPDWTPLFRSFGGRVSPAKLKRGANDFMRAGVIGGALRSDYRGADLAPQVLVEFFTRMEDFGLPGAFYYFINHANAASRGLGMAAGGQGRILYHCYDKVLAMASAASA